jgi:hypothetical protein
MTRVVADELVELERPGDNFEARARRGEFCGAAKLATGASDALTIAMIMNRAIRRDMANLLKTFGDEICVVMPVPISMPVPRWQNILPSHSKFNYSIVYVAR